MQQKRYLVSPLRIVHGTYFCYYLPYKGGDDNDGIRTQENENKRIILV